MNTDIKTCKCGNKIVLAAILDENADECATCYMKRIGKWKSTEDMIRDAVERVPTK